MNNRFFKKESTQGTLTLTPNEDALPSWQSQIPERGRVGMPRESTDHRVRNWTSEEKQFVFRALMRGTSMRSIRMAIPCSYAPLKRMLQEEGVMDQAGKLLFKK